MNKELQKRAGRDFSLTPFGEMGNSEKMLSKLKPIQPNYLEFYHPFGYHEPKGSIIAFSFMGSAVVGSIVSALVGPLVGMSMVEFWITSSVITASATSVMSILGFANGNPKAKIRNFFSKIFFSKKQQQKLSESYANEIQDKKNIKEYNDAWEAYKILVQQEIEKLKAKGVFEEQAMMDSGQYWYIDDYGELKTMDKNQYFDKFMGKPLSNATIQKEIIEKIAKNYQESQKMIDS